MRLIGWPLSLFFAAQFAVFALLDFGTGELARLVAIGLQASLLLGFVFWHFAPQNGGWPSPQACAHVTMFAFAALALIFFDPPGIQIGFMLALLQLVNDAVVPPPKEKWPPEPSLLPDAIWPKPSPARTGLFAFFGGIVVCFAPSRETFLIFGICFVVLMVLRGFAVARHVHWRPMPIWRPGLLRLYGPIACYGVFLFGLEGDPTLHRSLIALLFPFLLLAASNLGENLGRRWMARWGGA